MMETIIQFSFVVAAALFIFGLKQLGSPATARQGNLISSFKFFHGTTLIYENFFFKNKHFSFLKLNISKFNLRDHFLLAMNSFH